MKELETKKQNRFKLIEDALKVVIEPLQKIVVSDDLGFSAETLDKYQALKIKTKSNYEYFSFLADTMIDIYKKSTDECFWQIYKPTFLQAQSESGLEFKEKYEHKHIDNAIQNAFYFFFGLYAILPKIYQNTFNRELDDETFKKLIINSNKFAKTMSIIHFDMFRSFLNSSSQTKSGVATQLHMFIPDTFVIDENLQISMSQVALARAKAHTKRLLDEGKAFIDKENPTLGCPAKFVKLDADRDLIDLLHIWIIKVVNKYLF